MGKNLVLYGVEIMSILLIFSRFLVSLFLVTFLTNSVYADRVVLDLSEQDWGLYRDFSAVWMNDEIYPPPVDITQLPVNSPSCGWDNLNRNFEKIVHLPATVEEYFWGDNTNDIGMGGDWRGVSWWVTTVDISPQIRGKEVFLDFESVHLRAEVYVNRVPAGYDVVGHTPFEMNVTRLIKPGERNEIAVRVTDPNGQFDYDDLLGMRWGKNILPRNRGFGGIPGRVYLRAVDPVYMEDIHVRNKPSLKDVDVIVEMKNLPGIPCLGTFSVRIYPWNHRETVIWEKSFKRKIEKKDDGQVFEVKANKAEIWDLDHPNLYIAEVSFESDNGKMKDTSSRRFGFRWFDIGQKNGDQRFYLNGKRIVLVDAYSWSLWPVNGAFPTREMAEKETAAAKKLGYNTISVHTAIPYPLAMDAADEAGLLYYEEPGGYYRRNNEEKTVLRSTLSREKFLRMVKRDRSHPSLVIYNMGWNYYDKPEDDNIRDMKTAHELDPTRIITFRQGIQRNLPKSDPRKLFMKPNDFTEYNTGFFEECISIGSQGYQDSYYRNPHDYYLHSGTTDEIVFWGEDGNIGVPPRLQSIKEYYDRNGEPYGWQGRSTIEWFKAYDTFLDASGFRAFFPNVDSLTVSLGNVKYYHHGRILENIRMGNAADNYTIIGWGSSQVFNHNGMVDLYRNPVGIPELFSYYTRPLYIAVKLRNKVVPAGSTVVSDFFIINEADIKGDHTLSVTLEHDGVKTSFSQEYEVAMKGGEEYGQLLVENVGIGLGDSPGYYTVRAELRDRKGTIVASGNDRVFAGDLSGIKISPEGAVIDSTGNIRKAVNKIWGINLPDFTSKSPDLKYIIVGRGRYSISDVMDRVANGATAVVIDQADKFADLVKDGFEEALDYRGRYEIKGPAFGGNFIAGKHALLQELPQAQAFNWEYQIFYLYGKENLFALRISGVKPVIAAVSDHKKEVGTALCIVPYGRGRIILSTLDIVPYLTSETPQSWVAKQLFGNFLEYANKEYLKRTSEK
jgi:beta-galactosidase